MAAPRAWGWALWAATLWVSLAGCVVDPELNLDDDPLAYIENQAYRRAILERDVTVVENDYVEERFAFYAVAGLGWDLLPERDPKSRAFTTADINRLANGQPLALEDMTTPSSAALSTTLVPTTLPTTDEGWIALGKRVFFEYPLRVEPHVASFAHDRARLEEVGFIPVATGSEDPARPEDEVWTSIRVFEDELGEARIGHTCAQCHASRDANTGDVTAVRSNRAMRIGDIRLHAEGLTPGDLPPELDSTALGDLDRLGGGRADVLDDQTFDPYAFPDLGGLVDMPYLHHNANWRHEQTATLAVRCETLFITSSRRTARIPRALSWAIALYYRSLPAPAPLNPSVAPDPALIERGAEIFEEQTCVGCHTPPLFTSDRWVTVDEIGTHAAAGHSRSRFSGAYRIPSLRGVGGNAPYLHHGAFSTLEAMFDPDREEPGHSFGLGLDDEDRAALLAFLRSI